MIARKMVVQISCTQEGLRFFAFFFSTGCVMIFVDFVICLVRVLVVWLVSSV